MQSVRSKAKQREVGTVYQGAHGVKMIMTEDGRRITFEAWCEHDDQDQEEALHDAMVQVVSGLCNVGRDEGFLFIPKELFCAR